MCLLTFFVHFEIFSHIQVPRKSGADIFQEDIYPDCYAGKPVMNADKYMKGENKVSIFENF